MNQRHKPFVGRTGRQTGRRIQGVWWGLLVCLCGLPAVASGTPAVQLEDIANVAFQMDRRFFFVMTALEAARAGSPVQDTDLLLTPLQDAVREDIRSVDLLVLQPLIDLLSLHTAQEMHSRLSSMALVMGPPSAFEFDAKVDSLPSDIRSLTELPQVFRQFYQACGGETLWQKYLPAYQQEAARFVPLLRDVFTETLAYFHLHARIALDRKIVIIPDLMNRYGSVNARNVGNNYYLILGPYDGQSGQRRGIRHEYMHFLVDPIVLKYRKDILAKDGLLKIVKNQSSSREMYRGDLPLVLTESLIRAAESRMAGEPDEDQRQVKLHEEYAQGLVLIFFFDRALGHFEGHREATLAEALPEFIAAISVDQEFDHAKRVDAERKELNSLLAAKTRIPAVGAEADEVTQRLRQANGALQARDFALARALLEPILARDPANPNALFGLAQIDEQTGRLDDALQRYNVLCVQTESPDWVKAWSRVRGARIYLSRGDRDEALKHLRGALAMTGDTRGASEAARRLMTELGEPIPPPRRH